MPAFDESDFGVQSPLSPVKSRENNPLQRVASRGNQGAGSYGSSLTIPGDGHAHDAIEVPATRSSISDAQAYMHKLSLSPSMKERRSSRNSFGASLPILRSKRLSRLSSVYTADGRPVRPGMPPIQPSREILAVQVQDIKGEKVKAAKDMAFVFDIDAVLVHGDRLIPEGKRVLGILNGDELGIKIPHIFLTNGSGKPEQARMQQLPKILHSPVSVDQFIQPHTPMRALAGYYDTILVVGGEGYRCRKVAERYEFRDIVVPNGIVAWDPTIEAIMVSDSRDHATDMQIIMDLLRSENGHLKTVAKDPSRSGSPSTSPRET